MVKSFQHTVATGRFTLPTTIMYAVIMLIAGGAITTAHWIQILLLGFSTFLMVVLNNSNALIRVYSRMVSCSFLTLMVMNPILLDSVKGCVVQVLFILMLLLLFKAYQDRHAVGTIFYAFVCLGIISTQFVQILFFVPFIWVMIFTSLQEGSLKVLIASILGLVLPYWFWASYTVYEGSPTIILDHFESIATFGPLFEGLFNPNFIIPMIFITILGIVGTIHFLSTGYGDNIKTRMFYNVIVTLFLASLLFIIIQPQHSDYLLRIVIICLSPLVAHFLTFTNSWLTNLSFYGILAATIAITIFNTWTF